MSAGNDDAADLGATEMAFAHGSWVSVRSAFKGDAGEVRLHLQVNWDFLVCKIKVEIRNKSKFNIMQTRGKDGMLPCLSCSKPLTVLGRLPAPIRAWAQIVTPPRARNPASSSQMRWVADDEPCPMSAHTSTTVACPSPDHPGLRSALHHH